MVVKVADSKVRVIGGKGWFRLDGIVSIDNDSLVLNNVRLRIAKSTDSLYHISYIKLSSGSDEDNALKNINEIKYGVTQDDSVLYLDRGFSLGKIPNSATKV